LKLAGFGVEVCAQLIDPSSPYWLRRASRLFTAESAEDAEIKIYLDADDAEN